MWRQPGNTRPRGTDQAKSPCRERLRAHVAEPRSCFKIIPASPFELFLLYHNALGLAFTLLKEHEYIIIHTKERVIVYELPAFPATKAIFIRKLNFILAPI